jgi:hypothetical protein
MHQVAFAQGHMTLPIGGKPERGQGSVAGILHKPIKQAHICARTFTEVLDPSLEDFLFSPRPDCVYMEKGLAAQQ